MRQIAPGKSLPSPGKSFGLYIKGALIILEIDSELTYEVARPKPHPISNQGRQGSTNGPPSIIAVITPDNAAIIYVIMHSFKGT